MFIMIIEILLKCHQLNFNEFLILNRSTGFTKKYKSDYSPIVQLLGLGEEVHNVNCEPNLLLVEHGDFISEGFELIPGLFSKDVRDYYNSSKK
jgi:hypothetical protein